MQQRNSKSQKDCRRQQSKNAGSGKQPIVESAGSAYLRFSIRKILCAANPMCLAFAMAPGTELTAAPGPGNLFATHPDMVAWAVRAQPPGLGRDEIEPSHATDVTGLRTIASEVVIIDAALDNVEQLAKAAPADAYVFLLSQERSGIEQIANILSGFKGVDTLHLFSHGSPGSLVLGSDVVQTNSLAYYSSTLQQFREALSDKADIVLYGCNAARGAQGREFIEALAEHTGADVAGSTDITGHRMFVGDWDMEVSTGPVTASALAVPEYVGRMANYIVKNTNDTGTDSLRQAIADSNASAGADTIAFASSISGTINAGSKMQITDDLTIIGPGADRLTVNGGGSNNPIFHIYSGSYDDTPKTAKISGLKITNSGTGSGAVYAYQENLELNHMDISGNNSRGVMFTAYPVYPNLSIYNSVISNNTGAGGGGGVQATYGSYTIGNSTISNNTTTSYGGGLWTDADYGAVKVFNTTIVDNTKNRTNAWAGGWYILGGGYTAQMIHCTIGHNNDDASGPQGPNKSNVATSGANLKVYSSIIADGDGTNLLQNVGSITVSTSIIEGGTWTTGGNSNADPGLGALTSNGGPVKTIVPTSGTNAGAADTLTHDARGYRYNGTADIGAYESSPTQFIYRN
ncbi:MAG: DUF4347 domain-containing protein, partial [Gammaproteobacteria bacterium]|nr:DUF4347 domain-containing protein [Gammaproteobacteria bacterium]